MSKRREFKTAVKAQIIKRATRTLPSQDAGPLSFNSQHMVVRDQYCEKCGQPTKCRFEIHHLTEDALEVDKSKPLTAADGALWCVPCHDEHTAKVSIPIVAKAKRREAAHLGAKRDKQPIASDPHALKSRARPKHEGRTGLPPRPMFVKLGDVASGVLAKLNPRKAAE